MTGDRDVTVVVATFGDDHWAELAQDRAVPSAVCQARTIHVHGHTLADARNRGLASTKTRYVIHLDADDQLTPGYVATLAAATGDMRVPAVQYVKHGRAHPPRMPTVAGHTHACTAECLVEGNWCVIGTWASAELLLQVGGWEDQPVYEDWSLMLRAHLAGATFTPVPAAVYRAWWRPNSRNRAPTPAFKAEWHQNIWEAAAR